MTHSLTIAPRALADLVLGLPAPSAPAAHLPENWGVPDPADMPAWDCPYVPGLTWCLPLDERPIVITDHPEVRPVLDLRAGRFWQGSRHGLSVGRARAALDAAAVAYALAPQLDAAPDLAAALAETAAEWTLALDGAAADWAICLGVSA